MVLRGPRMATTVRVPAVTSVCPASATLDGPMHFHHGVQVLHGENNLAGASRSPAFKEAGASSCSDHVNGAVRALSSSFACGQLKVLTHDQRHRGWIMHRGHGGHLLPSVQFPTSSSHRGRCEAWVQSTAQRRRFQGREPHQTGDLVPAGQGIAQPRGPV